MIEYIARPRFSHPTRPEETMTEQTRNSESDYYYYYY